MPIPRFDDENKFYRDHFSDENLWLDISYDREKGVLQSKIGHVFARNIQTITGPQIIMNFDWMFISFLESQTELAMSSDGKWHTLDENQLVDSVCVYNILPPCSQCHDEGFCKYTDGKKEEIECVCPIGRGGKFCQNNYCNCKNESYCKVDETTNEIECVCEAPFFGQFCESKSTTTKTATTTTSTKTTTKTTKPKGL